MTKENHKVEYVNQKEDTSLFDPFDTSPFITKETPNGDHLVVPINENIIRAMEILPSLKDSFRLNLWTGRKETCLNGDNWRPLVDYDYIVIKRELVNSFPFTAIRTVTSQAVIEGTDYLTKKNEYDPVLDYLKSLEWDGEERIKDLYKVFNAEENETNSLFVTSWILGLVRRLIEPGSKYDYVLVLEGAQGIGKSLFFNFLTDIFKKGDDNLNHLETTISPDNKDFYMQMVGRIVVEFTEGEIFSKASQEAIKAVITKRVDSFRMPFAKEVIDVPRRFVFAMTTNTDDYLRDDSGARRWLPIACGDKIDVMYIKENRDQIFAEAYHRLTVLKEKPPYVETKEARLEQQKRKMRYAQEDWVVNWYLDLPEERRQAGVTTTEAFDEAVVINNSFIKLDRRMEISLGNDLKRVLKLEKKQVYIDKKRYYKYLPTEKSEQLLKEIRGKSKDNLEIF